MTAPINGMTVVPEGFGDPLMMGAWLDFVRWAIHDADVQAQYRAETGRDLLGLMRATPFERMIDDATGRQEAEVAAFCDWATVVLWGIDERGSRP